MYREAQNAWLPYEPSPANPWTLAKVGHLYRRAGFGGSYPELRAGLALKPQELVDRLVHPPGDINAFEAETTSWSQSIRKGNNIQQASDWWLYRMLKTPFPLREKMTLFWHNHFATSFAKVLNIGYMLGQYELMHQHALGNFAEMLQGISKDPAMLVWLDTIQSKKGMPNENYARELMELFSLGIGNYTENDIREAARAFTGWEIRNGEYHFNKDQFDAGEKAVFGRKGPFSGEQIVQLCLEKEACALFIVKKLYRFLISESAELNPELLKPLVEQFRKDYNIGQLVETMLRSNHFFAAENYRAKVKSPVDFICGVVLGLQGSVGVSNLARSLESLGQNLFSPPSVKGWDGGPAWLNAQTLLYRQNLALQLCETRQKVDGTNHSLPLPSRLLKLAGVQSDPAAVDLFLEVFLQKEIPTQTRDKLLDFAAHSNPKSFPSYWSEERKSEHKAISLCHMILTLPEWQLD
jgi:uncharacterized protein (DUF1800 family)